MESVAKKINRALKASRPIVKNATAALKRKTKKSLPHVGPDNTCKRCGDYWPCACARKNS